MRTNIGGLLAKRAELNPQNEALVVTETGLRLTYEALNRRANQAAAALATAGLTPAERCALLMKNSAEFIETFFALAKMGVVVVPLNWRLTAAEISYILTDSGAVAIIFDTDFAATVEDACNRLAPDHQPGIRLAASAGETGSVCTHDYARLRAGATTEEPDASVGDDDLLFIMYTSGTTGRPKGAMHTHKTIFWAILSVAATLDMRRGDRSLVMMPMFHVGALSSIVTNAYLGTTVVLAPAFDPRTTWELIDREQISVMSAVPTMLAEMARVYDASLDHHSLRWIVVGAAPVPVSLFETYAGMGINLYQIYGLTESGGPACALQPEWAQEKIGSTGKAFFHARIRVVDADGADVAAGEVGEVLVSAPHVTTGYWQNPVATTRAFEGEWLQTGDLARIDADGFIYIVDRAKDVIISGGENIYPAEIEAVLHEHAAIVDAAVIGQPDTKWGEVPIAYVVTSDAGLDAAQLHDFCQSRLARFKMPKTFRLVDQLPRNASGKILKHHLRADTA